ncbi:hypothetical protein [Histophilus somni]|uniref:Uncharacterized protein n=1 Tax=Histophilus somni TaxID=731 RepID=A0AAX2S3E4_HISSO|nr:hypothetical protein [Histophilus somni]TDF43101.1 hypothetical protein E1290_02130 [Histophilus somni]TEW29698.1 hypothetical protein E2R48_05860 [Histophilus somni]TFF01435.1 hypothetical protein E3U35_06080 [Histophilus somni]THA21471.1 hypothetical protein E5361_05775 [Histophilus somni]THA94274.1 hypothetical protein E6A58_05085 [Histophilus somni]
MTKPVNAEYIKEIIDKTNNLGYLDIQGKTLQEKQESFKSLIQEKLKGYHNDSRKDHYHRS